MLISEIFVEDIQKSHSTKLTIADIKVDSGLARKSFPGKEFEASATKLIFSFSGHNML